MSSLSNSFNPSTAELNLFWSATAAELFAQWGVRNVCISPGSRNTPLILGFTRHPELDCSSHIDERSAAFFALGISRSSRIPAVLICTSGTAGANYYPAVMEASQSRTPLIVLTADRPARLVGTGANQTTRQDELFGCHVRHTCDMGLPEYGQSHLTLLLLRAWRFAMGIDPSGRKINPPGPVHLNFPFEEPLYDQNMNMQGICTLAANGLKKISDLWQYETQPGPAGSGPTLELQTVIGRIKNKKDGLIVCGKDDLTEHRESILKLGRHLQWPVLADPLSGLRYSSQPHPEWLIAGYDLFAETLDVKPDQVIRFGSKPVSKQLNRFLDRYQTQTILVDPVGRFNDDCPTVVSTAVDEFCDAACRLLPSGKTGEQCKRWMRSEADTIALADHFCRENPEFEGAWIRRIVNAVPDGSRVFVSNSMPVRDLDCWGGKVSRKFSIMANRGISGIDGIVSTALGMSHNYSGSSAHFLITGDLAFIHDVGGLAQQQRLPSALTIIVLNNQGGGIFNFLPVSQTEESLYQTYWETRHAYRLDSISNAFGCKYVKVDENADLTQLLETCSGTPGVTVMEIPVSGKRSRECALQFRRQVNLQCR